MWRSGVIGLLAACLVIQGCLGQVMGTLVAPQSVAVGAASNLVNQGTSAIDGANQAASTVADLDRIIAANPNAENTGELMALREELGRRVIPGTTPRKRGIPPPPSEFDRRIAQPTQEVANYPITKERYAFATNPRNGNQLVVQRDIIDDLSAAESRSEVRPFSAARTSSLPPARESIYQYGWNPDPQPIDPRRGE